LDVAGGVVRLPLGFAGGLFDADTGLTRFVWRDYDADTGRFTALDPLGEKGGDNDWYGYCLDAPINRADVWGLSFWKDIEDAVSPTIGNIVSAASTIGTEALKQARIIAPKVATRIGVLTAPLGDLIDPTPVNDVYEESKEFWDQWGKDPNDLRNRH